MLPFSENMYVLPLIQNHSESFTVYNKTRKRIKSIEINSVIKNEIVSFAKKWVQLEVKLSKINQTEQDKYCNFSLICQLLIVKLENKV